MEKAASIIQAKGDFARPDVYELLGIWTRANRIEAGQGWALPECWDYCWEGLGSG